jgi:hypothetical protein
MRIFLLLVISLVGACTKPLFAPEKVPAITIKGQIFESRSNPIPMVGYSLLLGQSPDIGPQGLIGDLDTIKKTDSEGRFAFHYQNYDEYSIRTTNQRFNGELGRMSISAWDESKPDRLTSLWLGFECLKNYNIDSLFMYKSIQTVVRKIKFERALAAGDSLEAITSKMHTATYKKVYGPIGSGSFLTIDTIRNLKISVFIYNRPTYMLRSALKKPGFQTNHDIEVGLNDEIYREIIMTY